MTYALLTETMEEQDRKDFDFFLTAEPDEVIPDNFQYGLAAERAAALAQREREQQESNVEGLMAAFSLPQAPRGDNR